MAKRNMIGATVRGSPLVQALTAWLDGMVHPSARGDDLTFARHRAFIATRVLPGLAALSVLPAYVGIMGAPGPIETITFASFILPILVAIYLGRTGHYAAAHVLSALALALVVSLVAGLSGGLTSFVIIWFALVPAEAVLANSRRVVAIASAIAAVAIAVVGFAGIMGVLPEPRPSLLSGGWGALVCAASAMFYAVVLAFGAAHVGSRDDEAKSVGERRYRLLAEHMTDVITRHARTGAVTFVSPAAERLAGVSPFALHGQGLFERVHVADRPAYLTALSTAAARGEEGSVEFRLRREAGGENTYVWVEMRCRPLAAALGEEAQVVAVLRDVSDRKGHEAEIETARAEADRANEAKSRFLANVSHELRTPLNAIIGFSEMLQHEEAMRLDLARRTEYAGLIRDSGEHLLNLVNSILDMSKIESGNFEITPEPFALKPLIEHCGQLLALKAEASGVALRVDVRDGLPELIADKRACRQILLNLVVNAIKFTRAGGSVTISAWSEGQTVAIGVVDTGIGMAPEDVAQLGRAFFQARSAYDRPHEGTGLGLSITKGLVGLHGGRIDFASELGKGTRAVVRLPFDCEAARSRIVVHPAPARSSQTGSAPADQAAASPMVAAISEPRVLKRA